jgi:hypothetical protein
LLFFGIADGMIFSPPEHYGDDTMLVKRCFLSAFGDGIMQMIRVEVVRELIFLYSMLACYNPTGYA